MDRNVNQLEEGSHGIKMAIKRNIMKRRSSGEGRIDQGIKKRFQDRFCANNLNQMY